LNWQYQYPELFWALLAIPMFVLFFIGDLLWKKRAALRIGDPKLAKELYKGYSPYKSFIKFLFISIAFAAGCIAVANPRKPDETSAEARKGIDIMIALDVSNSMLADDISPNRFVAAKTFLNSLIQRLPDDRIGLVLFAGEAYVQMPLTFDHGATEVILSSAAPSAFKSQGTVISQALEKADLSFQEESKRFKTIVLITDGETHDTNAEEKAKELGAKGIMINAVGLGSATGTTIIDTISGGIKKDLSGNTIISKLNEALLQQIAASTNGQYVHLTDVKAATDALVLQLSQIEKKAMADTSKLNYTTYYFWLAWPMLLLLLSEIFFPDRKKAKL